MKKLLLSAAFAVPFMMNAQTTVASEDFDSYTDGDLLTDVGVANGWREWADGTGFSSIVSANYAVSGMLSGRSVSDSIYDSDGIWSWTDVTSGQYTLKMNLYVPAGSAGGYIGIGDSQMDNNGNYSSMDYYIIGDTLLAAWDGSNYFAQGALVPNQWDAVVLMVDLDAGTSELMLNGVSIGTGTTGNLATNGFGGLDLWGTEVDITANPSSYNPGDYYFDDFEVLNMSTTEIDEISAMEINISPNPSNGEFAINFNDYEFDNASLTITNMLGAVVYSEQLSSVSNSTKNFNLDLNSGVYVVRVADNKNEMTSRVVIK